MCANRQLVVEIATPRAILLQVGLCPTQQESTAPCFCKLQLNKSIYIYNLPWLVRLLVEVPHVDPFSLFQGHSWKEI